MNLNSSKSRITGLTREIALRWADTRNHWRDARSAEFDQRFMQELFARVNTATAALDKLEELGQRIRKDCE
jgi:hypothetical protein